MLARIGWLSADCMSILPSPSAKVFDVAVIRSKAAATADFLNMPNIPISWFFLAIPGNGTDSQRPVFRMLLPKWQHYSSQILFDQNFSNLDAVERGAFAHVIGNHPQV